MINVMMIMMVLLKIPSDDRGEYVSVITSAIIKKLSFRATKF